MLLGENHQCSRGFEKLLFEMSMLFDLEQGKYKSISLFPGNSF